MTRSTRSTRSGQALLVLRAACLNGHWCLTANCHLQTGNSGLCRAWSFAANREPAAVRLLRRRASQVHHCALWGLRPVPHLASPQGRRPSAPCPRPAVTDRELVTCPRNTSSWRRTHWPRLWLRLRLWLPFSWLRIRTGLGVGAIPKSRVTFPSPSTSTSGSSSVVVMKPEGRFLMPIR